MRRVKQEQILRFSEVGWQVWNMWGSRLFASCADPNFHPLGIITDEEWENEEKRIQDIDNQGIRLAQQNNLEEVKRLRDSEFQRFHMKPHEFSRALPEATKTLKAFGVSSQLCLFAAGIFTLSRQDIFCEQFSSQKYMCLALAEVLVSVPLVLL